MVPRALSSRTAEKTSTPYPIAPLSCPAPRVPSNLADRLSPFTTDIRMCVDYWRSDTDKTTCRGGFGTATGQDGNQYCAAGLTGPLCHTCIDRDKYLDVSRAECVDCPAAALAMLPLGSAVLGGVLLCAAWRQRQRWSTSHSQRLVDSAERASDSSSHLLQRLGLVAKAKILVGYFQVVLVMPEAFAVPLPDQ